MKKGNFVFHTGGWGTGEIIDVSLVREELTLEFEYVVGPQHFSFEKAFKTLLPLTPDHFYSRRFGNPDVLEKEARENPSEVIRLLSARFRTENSRRNQRRDLRFCDPNGRLEPLVANGAR